MTDNRINQRIDKALKKIWAENIIPDYNKDYLLKEDTLKNSIYYHLRNELGDGFLDRNRLRIYTEYYLGENKNKKRQIADIAIVQLKLLNDMNDGYMIKDRVENIITIMELKFKGNTEKHFRDDVKKIKEYTRIKKCRDSKFYLGFIYEATYSTDIGSWLYKSQSENWAHNKVTELTAHYDEETEEFVSNIICHPNVT